jgi:hypothetical protein
LKASKKSGPEELLENLVLKIIDASKAFEEREGLLTGIRCLLEDEYDEGEWRTPPKFLFSHFDSIVDRYNAVCDTYDYCSSFNPKTPGDVQDEMENALCQEMADCICTYVSTLYRS